LGWDWDCATVAGFWCESRPCDSHAALRLIHLGASRESCASCESCASRASRVCPACVPRVSRVSPVCLVCVSCASCVCLSPCPITSPRLPPDRPRSQVSQPPAVLPRGLCRKTHNSHVQRPKNSPQLHGWSKGARPCRCQKTDYCVIYRTTRYLSHYSSSIALLVIYCTTRHLSHYSLSIALPVIYRTTCHRAPPTASGPTRTARRP
jgi:hypothetical protein